MCSAAMIITKTIELYPNILENPTAVPTLRNAESQHGKESSHNYDLIISHCFD